MTPREQHRAAVFARDGNECALVTAGGCEGPPQADHILKESVLSTWHDRLRGRDHGGEVLPRSWQHFLATPLDTITADARNGWVLCMNAHHAAKDRKLMGSELAAHMRARIPLHFFEFVYEYGLEPVVERELGVKTRDAL